MFPLHSHPLRAQLEVVHVPFLCQMKAHFFLIITPKFQLQIHYTWAVIAKKKKKKKKNSYFRYTNCDFLMYFHNSLIPSVTFLFLSQKEKLTSNLEVKLHKMCLSGQSPSVNLSENTHIKMGTTHLWWFFFFFSPFKISCPCWAFLHWLIRPTQYFKMRIKSKWILP